GARANRGAGNPPRKRRSARRADGAIRSRLHAVILKARCLQSFRTICEMACLPRAKLFIAEPENRERTGAAEAADADRLYHGYLARDRPANGNWASCCGLCDQLL